MAGRACRRLGPLVLAAGLAGSLSLATGSSLVRACDPVPVPFERIVERAPTIFLVTVAQRSMAGSTPQSYTLVVREMLRGELPEDVTLPTTVTMAAPVVNACGDVLDVRITTHLVLALDVPAFDGAQALTVPWTLRPEGTLEGGYDDGPATWRDVDALRAALEGRPFATPGPTTTPAAGIGEVEGLPVASLAIVAALLLGALAGVLVILGGRRAGGSRTQRPPGAS
jgi:hypothetical protein